MFQGGHVHEDDLDMYALGRLDEAQATVIREHTQQCPLCATRAADALAFAAKLARLREEMRKADFDFE